MDGPKRIDVGRHVSSEEKVESQGKQDAQTFRRQLNAENPGSQPGLTTGEPQAPKTKIRERKALKLTSFQRLKCAFLSFGLRFLPIKVLRNAVYKVVLSMYMKADSREVKLKERLLAMLLSSAQAQNQETMKSLRQFLDNEELSPLSKNGLFAGQPVNMYKPELFRLDYRSSSGVISAAEQAQTLFKYARNQINLSDPRSAIAFTYSANLAQARYIEQCQLDGAWKLNIEGSNQAQVVIELMRLLEKPENAAYRGRVMPAAIPTIEYVTHLHIPPFSMRYTTRGQIDQSIALIRSNMLEQGVRLLVLQNQDSVKNPVNPYAVGGGVAQRAKGYSNIAHIKSKIDELMTFEGL